MSTPDVPDYQRGTVAPTRLLASLDAETASVTVDLDANITALWVFVEPPPDPGELVCNGTTTEVGYPVYPYPAGQSDDPNFPYLIIVSPTVDAAVELSWGTAPGAAWFVVADTGPRVILDAATAAAVGFAGNAVPSYAELVAGSDGTDLRPLLTDDTGRLEVADSASGAAIGTPGSPPPAKAIQVAGTDTTDLRVLLVDSSGHVLSVDQNLKNAIGTPGAAETADAILVAGADGTDLRAILVDASGHVLSVDQNLKNAIGAPAAPPPSDALLIAGSDGTDLRAALTDASGHLRTQDIGIEVVVGQNASVVPSDGLLVGGSDGTDFRALKTDTQGIPFAVPSAPGETTDDHPPNELQVASASGNTYPKALVAAPGAGKRIRLFGLYIVAAFTGSGGATVDVEDSVSSTILGTSNANTSFIQPFTLGGLPSGIPLSTNAALNVINGGGTGFYNAVAVYTVETV